jgi:hypothetical protein
MGEDKNVKYCIILTLICAFFTVDCFHMVDVFLWDQIGCDGGWGALAHFFLNWIRFD